MHYSTFLCMADIPKRERMYTCKFNSTTLPLEHSLVGEVGTSSVTFTQRPLKMIVFTVLCRKYPARSLRKFRT